MVIDINTGPADLITSVRKKLAAAVGIRPKNAITISVLVSGIGGRPSTIKAIGMTMAADINNKTVDRPIVSTAGNRRIMIELTP